MEGERNVVRDVEAVDIATSPCLYFPKNQSIEKFDSNISSFQTTRATAPTIVAIRKVQVASSIVVLAITRTLIKAVSHADRKETSKFDGLLMR